MFRNANLYNLENVLQRSKIKEQKGPGCALLEHLEA